MYLKKLSNSLFRGMFSVSNNKWTANNSIALTVSVCPGDGERRWGKMFTRSTDDSCCCNSSHFLFASSKRFLYFSIWDCWDVTVRCCRTQSSSKFFTLHFKSWISSSFLLHSHTTLSSSSCITWSLAFRNRIWASVKSNHYMTAFLKIKSKILITKRYFVSKKWPK